MTKIEEPGLGCGPKGVYDQRQSCRPQLHTHHFLCASTGDIRLVGGSLPSEGRVELFHEGEWGRVVVSSSNSDTVARVACRQAGYPYTEGTRSFEQGSGPVWVVISWCTGDEKRVEQCVHYGWRSNICLFCPDLGVRCRGECVVCEEHTHTHIVSSCLNMAEVTSDCHTISSASL